jgi:hypothetical protein
MKEVIHVIGGGTVYHVRPHLALSAVAYGKAASEIATLCETNGDDDESEREVHLHLTKMANAGRGDLETNDDIEKLVDRLIADPTTKVIFMTAALCDFTGTIVEEDGPTKSGKDQPRLRSRSGPVTMQLLASEKLIAKIRKTRKDIFLVGFKTTAGASEDDQYLAGLTLLKTTSCNLVLANDIRTRLNMIIAPELAKYAVTTDRYIALRELVAMADMRSRLSFTPTTLTEGKLIGWFSDQVPETLRTVVEWCIANGAYKPFRNVTVGHFAFRDGNGTLISSRRKRNFNLLADRDLVKVVFEGEKMTAYGAKPSAGTTSQYAVLSHFPEFDSIVHFHCPMKEGSKITVRSQKELECGSHQCGENTWKGMSRFGNLAAVMLDQHGPNIIFSSKGDPKEVIRFISENFDLSIRSDGLTGDVVEKVAKV